MDTLTAAERAELDALIVRMDEHHGVTHVICGHVVRHVLTNRVCLD
jgi:hypothetical protein